MADPAPVPLESRARRSRVTGLVVSFGRFWWDFLIGDTPELFVGAIAVVVLVALVSTVPGARTSAAFAFPLLVAGLLALSVWKAARSRP